MKTTKFYDSHTHDNKEYDNVFSIQSVDSNEHPPLKKAFTFGHHPWNKSFIDKDFENKLQQMISKKNFFGLGEIGLDRSESYKDSFPSQVNVFKNQLKLAKQFSISAIVLHSVRSYEDILRILKVEKIKANFLWHDFNANRTITEKILNLENHFFGFGKNLFLTQRKFHQWINLIPKDRILFETDASNYSIQEVYQQADKLFSFKKLNIHEQLKMNNEKFFSKRNQLIEINDD